MIIVDKLSNKASYLLYQCLIILKTASSIPFKTKSKWFLIELNNLNLCSMIQISLKMPKLYNPFSRFKITHRFTTLIKYFNSLCISNLPSVFNNNSTHSLKKILIKHLLSIITHITTYNQNHKTSNLTLKNSNSSKILKLSQRRR